MATENEELKETKKMLRHEMLKNLRLRMHMQVLVGLPDSRTAERFRQEAEKNADFKDFTIHYN